jgi:adenosylhomocysteine nucleosidase
MLGIVVSLPWELRSLTYQKIPLGTWRSIADNTLVALSGIGAEQAYTAGSVLISEGAKALLSWGCAAALDNSMSPGCLILPRRIIGVHGDVHWVSTEWHRRLYATLKAQQPIRTDVLVESAAVVRTTAEKRALSERTQAAATDMESAAQARLAEEHGLPFLAIRAIIDPPSSDIPDNVLKALDPHGRISVGKLLAGILLLPTDCIRIARLGIQLNAAQRALRKARELVLDASRF